MQSKQPPEGVGSKGLQKCVLKNYKTVRRMRHAQCVPTVPPLIFLELVTRGRLPKPVRIDGITSWDRFDLDAAYESMKGQEEQRRNPIEAHYGISDES